MNLFNGIDGEVGYNLFIILFGLNIKIYIMKSVLINCFSMLLFVLGSASSYAAKLVVPEEFVVERLNTETFLPSFFTKSTSLNVPSGQNVLVLKYSQMFEDDLEDHHTTVRSDAFMLIFSVGDEQEILFEFPEQLDIDSAHKFATKPMVTLLNEHGKALALLNKSLSEFNDQVMKESLTQQKIINQRALNQVVANAHENNFQNNQVTQTKANTMQNHQGELHIEPEVQASPDAIDMLKYWWLKATPKQRKAFQEFVN